MWQEYNYSGPPGHRPYFVYTPTSYQVGVTVPLIVMLHGCTQSAADFAASTRMNLLADEHNFIVAYPQQTRKNNSLSCWNWFDSAHHWRDHGEPAIIAGIVQEIQQNTAQWTIDTGRIYVAGISAGAAMSVILGATYPDVFAAIGVHSGLAFQAASSTGNGLSVARRGVPDPVQQGRLAYKAMGNAARVVPTIVFHGTKDSVNNIINGDQVAQQWIETNMLASQNTYLASFDSPTNITTGTVPRGHSYTTYTWQDSSGYIIQEYWKVNALGHAWSGGKSGGSFTDPRGPDASQALYTFFMNHSMHKEGHVTTFFKHVLDEVKHILHIDKTSDPT